MTLNKIKCPVEFQDLSVFTKRVRVRDCNVFLILLIKALKHDEFCTLIKLQTENKVFSVFAVNWKCK